MQNQHQEKHKREHLLSFTPISLLTSTNLHPPTIICCFFYIDNSDSCQITPATSTSISVSYSEFASANHFLFHFVMGFLVIVKHIAKVAWPTVMLIYPLYASIRAIESPSELDDQQWLTYWVLYSLITLFELTFYKILAWIPIWPYVKLVLLFWLVLPMFNGAAYIYENYVRKFVVAKEQPGSPELPKGKKQVYRMISPTARAGVERYIAIHGYDSLERVIKEAEKEEEKQEGSPAGADH